MAVWARQTPHKAQCPCPPEARNGLTGSHGRHAGPSQGDRGAGASGTFSDAVSSSPSE